MVRDGENMEKDDDEPENHDDTWQEQLGKFEKMELEDKFDFFYDRYEDPEVVDGDFALEIKFNPRDTSSRTIPEILLPDSETFEEFMNDYLHFLNPDYYQAATPYLYINSWLKFLLEKSLIEKTHLQTVINDLQSLKTDYEDFYREKCPDPEILEAFQDWPETTGTER